MQEKTPGIHHITAIAGDAQKNLDFYCGVLGLRLVKRTVNYDDPGTYHLYYGDRNGTPGSILTFFPWTSAGAHGRPGAGQVVVVGFSVPAGSLKFWKAALEKLRIGFQGPTERGSETVITLRDPDGMAIELVDSGAPPSADAWTARVPAESAIRGFHAAGLAVRDADQSADFLSSVLGMEPVGQVDGRIRLKTAASGIGAFAEIMPRPGAAAGRMGAGAVHHIAWRARDDAMQLSLRAGVVAAGTPATPVIDRTYFHSVYFQEPGSVLFEIATDAPGFAADEPSDRLGTALKLPAWLEADRSEIEKALPPLDTEQAVRGGTAWTPAG